ncbi:ABC transporter permease [Pantoea rodasii]|uniref:ABC transporter permease n=1 Tax=Pantoea rodasii TaxID=1076549 RepID=A0A2M9W5X8_9GAMM|nr:ABC transporter permease [Pantoea rodasii]PJZ02941.1 ABC transporter permease [Pantoea rodasii]
MTQETLSTRVSERAFPFAWKQALPLLVVVALMIFFSLTTDSFATVRNFSAIAGQASALLIACIGLTFVILMGCIDLSVGATVLLVSAATVTFMNSFGLVFSALPLALLLGTALGALNGTIYTLGRVPSFVVTLGSLSIFSGLALTLLQGRAVAYQALQFETVAIGQLIPHVPNIALWALLAWLISVFVALRTRFGRYSYLIGGGERVAHTAGIPVSRYKIYAFCASGLFAGLAGILSVARLGAAGPSLGSDLLLNSLAAIVVGGTSLAGGRGGPQRTLVGVLIIALMDNGLNLLGVSEFMQMVIKGAVVIAAVLTGRQSAQFVVK